MNAKLRAQNLNHQYQIGGRAAAYSTVRETVRGVMRSFRFRVRSDEYAENKIFYQPRTWQAVNLQEGPGLHVSS